MDLGGGEIPCILTLYHWSQNDWNLPPPLVINGHPIAFKSF